MSSVCLDLQPGQCQLSAAPHYHLLWWLLCSYVGRHYVLSQLLQIHLLKGRQIKEYTLSCHLPFHKWICGCVLLRIHLLKGGQIEECIVSYHSFFRSIHWKGDKSKTTHGLIVSLSVNECAEAWHTSAHSIYWKGDKSRNTLCLIIALQIHSLKWRQIKE